MNYELPNVAEDYVHRIGRTGVRRLPAWHYHWYVSMSMTYYVTLKNC